jgi:hypothetical protein
VTTLVLATIALVPAAVLCSVMWSLARAMREESSNAALRRDGVRVRGTVLDNTMTSRAQRRLLFSPVVEFPARDARSVSSAAKKVSATSWPKGATVELAYDAEDPTRFVLAGPPEPGYLIANAMIGVVVVAIMAGTVLVTYQIGDEFRHDKGSEPQPASTQPAGSP